MRFDLPWLIRKELLTEYRSRRIWAETVQLGVLTGLLFGLQVRLPAEYQHEVGATLLWVCGSLRRAADAGAVVRR